MRGRVGLMVLAGLAAWAGPAAAQADPCAGRLGPDRIIECLRPGGISGDLRGIRPARAPVAVPAARGGARPPVAAPVESSVDLTVPFGFDSAELTPDGTAALAALGSALKDPALSGARFRIAGHTDAQGTDAYNQALSERRAEAARRFLVEQAGVDSGRLAAVGHGRRQLYDAANPKAASNRRVQVIRVEN